MAADMDPGVCLMSRKAWGEEAAGKYRRERIWSELPRENAESLGSD